MIVTNTHLTLQKINTHAQPFSTIILLPCTHNLQSFPTWVKPHYYTSLPCTWIEWGHYLAIESCKTISTKKNHHLFFLLTSFKLFLKTHLNLSAIICANKQGPFQMNSGWNSKECWFWCKFEFHSCYFL